MEKLISDILNESIKEELHLNILYSEFSQKLTENAEF